MGPPASASDTSLPADPHTGLAEAPLAAEAAAHFRRPQAASWCPTAITLVLCLQTYTSQVESPLLLRRELSVTPQAASEDEGFSLKANPLTREVTATMRVEDGAALEMVIKLPLSWPLKTADVECRRTVGQLLCGAPACVLS